MKNVNLDETSSPTQYGMHILNEEELRMREYHNSLFHTDKDVLKQQRLEAAKLVHKMNKEKRERERHLKEAMERQQREAEEQRALELKFREEQRQRDLEEKRALILKRMEDQKFKKLQQQRLLGGSKSPLAIEAPPGFEGAPSQSRALSQQQRAAKPLYKQWEEKFQKEVENQSLEERKKVLEQIRNIKKPMTKEEILEHAKKYLEAREKHLEDHEKLMKEKQRISDHMTAKFHTRAYEEVAYQEQLLREEREERERLRRENLQKKQAYGQYVKQSFLPEISKDKENERLQMIEALKHPVREH